MPSQPIIGGAFRRRRDRSLGWAALESKQTAAIGRKLALPSHEIGAALPPELSPFPQPSRRTRDAREIALEAAKLALAWILALQLAYLAAAALLISVYRFVDPPATVLMAYRKWTFGWKIEAPRPLRLAKVPRYIRSMLVAIEDDKFYEHHGLDFEAFARAREINKRVGKPLYGGSTLTMQVARTLFLVPEKSYVRKYLEVLTALELEALLPKQRILELYFGYAEWGKGLFGMESASRRWYGRGISALSRDEAARLIALLSSPVKYGPDTLHRSGILRERYDYLSRRYDQPPAESVQEDKPPPSPEPSSADAEGEEAAPDAALPAVPGSPAPPDSPAP
jgi:monofunctional biosynthetic peptidoglycan transglycosylase